MNETQVLIVGAGPAGALLALLLARRGIETCLIERQTDFEREFRGEVLTPGGLAMLDQAEVGLASIPHRTPNHVIGYSNARPFLDFQFTEADGDGPKCVSQPALLRHLVELAQREPSFSFRAGETAKGIEWDPSGRPVVRTRDSQGEHHRRAELVIGADGRASAMRKHGDFTVRNLGAPMDIVWGKVAWPDRWLDEQVRFYLGGGHLLLALPAPDGDLQLAWVILKGAFGELKDQGIEGWFRTMSEHADSELSAHLADHAEAVRRPFLLDAQTKRTVGWYKRRILLVGDAAHTMSPVGAQGLNVALRDAVVAVNQLVPALQRGGDLDAAASSIEAIRAPEIDLIQRLAAQPPRFVLGTGRFHGWVRDSVVRLIGTGPGRSIARRPLELFMNGTRTIELDH